MLMVFQQQMAEEETLRYVLGGDTMALAVLIETAPCHIASLPVAVNIEYHSHRHWATEI
jgi:tartrate dehydratase alpha subunit/fumarate hydratase class I-like protein